MIQNADHSYDVCFGPEAPDGRENYWVQTVAPGPQNRDCACTEGGSHAHRRGARAGEREGLRVLEYDRLVLLALYAVPDVLAKAEDYLPWLLLRICRC